MYEHSITQTEELLRLSRGPIEHVPWGCLQAEIIVECRRNAADVLERTKRVLSAVIDCELSTQDSVDDWRAILPDWFVNASAPESDQANSDEIWTVREFVYWFQPEYRSWYWWDALVVDSDTLKIQLLVDSYPFGWGALRHLLDTAGGIQANLVVE